MISARRGSVATASVSANSAPSLANTLDFATLSGHRLFIRHRLFRACGIPAHQPKLYVLFLPAPVMGWVYVLYDPFSTLPETEDGEQDRHTSVDDVLDRFH